MMKAISIWALLALHDSVSALTSNFCSGKSAASKLSTTSGLKEKRRTSKTYHHKKRRKSIVCPEPEADLDMDRREAAFAMIGQLWASGAVLSSLVSMPGEATAVYGADATIALPNMMEAIDNRINKQCLVESLGNRECLVYLDPDKKIYKGADINILVERLEKSTAALAEIPSLVAEKKWSKVNSVLTGPMGSLGMTMDSLSKMSENEEMLCSLEKIVKNDLYAIAAATNRKNAEEILKCHEKATADLIAYAKALS